MLYPNNINPIRIAKNATTNISLWKINFIISPINPKMKMAAPNAININDICFIFIQSTSLLDLLTK